jgi:putative FmdB family regulatory protein
MPLYEYKCRKCGSKFEVIQKFSDAPIAVHDGCGGEVEKLVSLSSFALKGSGWYVTDYARKDSGGAKKDAKAESKPDAKPESKSDAKAESKPAGTAEKPKAESAGATAAAGAGTAAKE